MDLLVSAPGQGDTEGRKGPASPLLAEIPLADFPLYN